MPDEMKGQRVKQLVRNYFKEGHKSSNKRYTKSLDGHEESNTAQARNKAANRASNREKSGEAIYDVQQLYKRQGTGENYGKFLLGIPWKVDGNPGRSGNCGEMAELAMHLLHVYEHIPKKHLYLGRLSDPGQHILCLVSDSEIPVNQRTGLSFREFVIENRDYLIVDPWLNTSCLSGAYARETSERLRKWHQEGKRIYWTGKSGEGWYPPIGEYSTGMRASNLDLHSYTTLYPNR